MASNRELVFIGFFLGLCVGIAFYFSLWASEFTSSKVDTKRLREEFDPAHREAMEEESAVWRLKYDDEVKMGTERSRELRQVCVELIQLRKALEPKMKETESLKSRLSALQESKDALEQKVEETESIESKLSALQRMIRANEQLWEQVVLLTRELDNWISKCGNGNMNRVN